MAVFKTKTLFRGFAYSLALPEWEADQDTPDLTSVKCLIDGSEMWGSRQSQSFINLVTVLTYQFIRCQDKAFRIQHWIRLRFVQNVWVHSREREKNEFLVWMRHSAGAWMRPRGHGSGYNALVNTLSFRCTSLCVRQLFSEHLLRLLFTVTFSLFLDQALHNVNGTGDVFIVFLGFPHPPVNGQLFPTCMTLCKCACPPGLRA